jgi:hypothetical protein
MGQSQMVVLREMQPIRNKEELRKKQHWRLIVERLAGMWCLCR